MSQLIFTFPLVATEYSIQTTVNAIPGEELGLFSAPVLFRVSSGCACPITGQATSVTWPVIGLA